MRHLLEVNQMKSSGTNFLLFNKVGKIDILLDDGAAVKINSKY